MTTPTVTERFIALEPVTRDDFGDSDFADAQPRARVPEPPTTRDLVIRSLLRCPELATERRRG